MAVCGHTDSGFSHHVRWGAAARHGEGLPGPRRGSHSLSQHKTRTQIPPLLVSLAGAQTHAVVGVVSEQEIKHNVFPVTCSLHSHNTEVVKTCYDASSSLLHNHVVDNFPRKLGNLEV